MSVGLDPRICSQSIVTEQSKAEVWGIEGLGKRLDLKPVPIGQPQHTEGFTNMKTSSV